MSTTIAETILNQLGGKGRLHAFVRARGFYSIEEGRGLTFRFKGSRKADHVKIVLNGKDLYDVKVLRQRNYTTSLVDEANDVYAEQLVATFERFTGLFLHF